MCDEMRVNESFAAPSSQRGTSKEWEVEMSSIRSVLIIGLVSQCFLLTKAAFAHPASGIVVDAQGRVYFVYTNLGVMRVEPSGKLTNIHKEDKGGHWLA